MQWFKGAVVGMEARQVWEVEPAGPWWRSDPFSSGGGPGRGGQHAGHVTAKQDWVPRSLHAGNLQMPVIPANPW